MNKEARESMDNLLAILGKCEDGNFAGKVVFDSRQKMPTQKEVLAIIKKYINIIGIRVTLIEPPLDITGKYTGNYFDFIFESKEEQKTKIFYENRSLIEDFKNNPLVTWEIKDFQNPFTVLQVDIKKG